MSGSLVTAVVPLKALDRAKGRLAGALDPPDRRELTAWMFGRVVAALGAATTVDDVLVVVGDAAGEALAARHGVRSLREPRPGLPQALAAADAATAGRPATLVVAADLPLARPEDLDRVCAAGRRDPGPAVVVAPTQDGGTGALYRRPAGVVGTASSDRDRPAPTSPSRGLPACARCALTSRASRWTSTPRRGWTP